MEDGSQGDQFRTGLGWGVPGTFTAKILRVLGKPKWVGHYILKVLGAYQVTWGPIWN